jgi:hypothetical protein
LFFLSWNFLDETWNLKKKKDPVWCLFVILNPIVLIESSFTLARYC